MKALDPRLLQHARAARTLIVGSAVVGGLNAVATVVMAVALADLITAVAIDHRDPRPTSLISLLVSVLVKALMVWFADELPRRSAVRMVNQLRRALLDRIVAQDRTWTSRQKPGELIQLATSGVGGLQNYAARYLPQLILVAVVPGGIVVFLAFTDGLSALIVALTLPLVPLFMALVGLHSRDHAQKQLTALQLLGGHFLDLIGGLPTLKVFSRSKTQEQGIRDAGERYRVASLRTLKVAFLSSMVLELIATISVALVAVSIGLRLVNGTLDLRTGLTVLLVAPEAYAALRAVGTHFHASVDGLAAADQVFRVLDEPMPVDGAEPVPADHSLRLAGRLHGVDLAVAADDGRVTLLTGPSGAGKTTALGLMAGLARPESGAVHVGDVHLTDVDPAAWQQQVGVLVQAPYLQAGTVRDNVCALRPAAADSDVAQALWCAVADAVVDELPAGIDTVLTEGAPELSHGQRARIALARTLLADRPILLLDEPTAALDFVTEAELVRRLPVALAGRTVVIASHREALRGLADEVVTIDPIVLDAPAVLSGTAVEPLAADDFAADPPAGTDDPVPVSSAPQAGVR